MTKINTCFLEMKSRSELKPRTLSTDLQIVECKVDEYQFNRFLYQLVGGSWAWVDKLSWTEKQWKDYVEDSHLRTWVAYYAGTPAGYYELQQQAQGDVEIAYFGLAPGFIGRGFGAQLLTHALVSAWEWKGTKRVWVHTCSLDHPGALENYKARGMQVYRVETAEKEHKSRLAGFIIDCKSENLPEAAEFWGRALGLEQEILPGEEGQKYVRLLDPFDELHIEVQMVEHESRVHLDIETDDISAEILRLQSLGAKKLVEVGSWCVMQAPTGQKFCVVPKSSLNFDKRAKQW